MFLLLSVSLVCCDECGGLAMMTRMSSAVFTLLLFTSTWFVQASAQDETPSADNVAAEATASANDSKNEPANVAETIQVDPVNSDDRIANRLSDILDATGWFHENEVKVDRGVAFLSGITGSQKHQAWPEATAMNTSDVVAVVNRIKVTEQPDLVESSFPGRRPDRSR